MELDKEKILQMSEDELRESLIKSAQIITDLNNEIKSYKIAWAARSMKWFGTSSEKMPDSVLGLPGFNDLFGNSQPQSTEAIVQANEEDQKESAQKPKPKRKKSPNSRKTLDHSDLDTVKVVHDLSDEEKKLYGDRIKPAESKFWKEMVHISESYFWIEHEVRQYEDTEKGTESGNPEIVSSQNAPEPLMDGSLASPSLLADIIYSKFVQSIPLYRQEQDFFRNGIYLSRQTMDGWMRRLYNEYLWLITDKMQEDLRSCQVIHMDETALKVLDRASDETHTTNSSYLWASMPGRYEEKPMVYYYYGEGRKHVNVELILGEARGIWIHSDGYQSYLKYDEDHIIGCLAHVRRKFHDLIAPTEEYRRYLRLSKTDPEKADEFLESLPSLKRKVEILRELSAAFYEDKRAREKYGEDFEQIREHKIKFVKPHIDRFYELAAEIEANQLAYGEFRKACQYALNQKDAIFHYFEDGRFELSNNRAESIAIKPITIGRKNWLFCKSEEGAEILSAYYSLVRSAILNDLHPLKYLEYVIRQFGEGKVNMKDLSSLTPYSKDLPKNLKSGYVSRENFES